MIKRSSFLKTEKKPLKKQNNVVSKPLPNGPSWKISNLCFMINKMKKTKESMSIYLTRNKISIKASKLSFFQLQKDNNRTVKTNNPQFEWETFLKS